MVRLDDGSAEPHPRLPSGGRLPHQRAAGAAPARSPGSAAAAVQTPRDGLDVGLGDHPDDRHDRRSSAERAGAERAGAERAGAERASADQSCTGNSSGWRHRLGWLRRIGRSPSLPRVVLALAASFFAMTARAAPEALPWVTVALFILIGLTLMHPVFLLLDVLGVGSVVITVLTLAGLPALNGLSIGLVLLGSIVLGLALHRDRDEVIGAIGGAAAADAMLIDLRERIRRRREPPALPPQWLLEIDLRAARGDGFCGDFVVAATETGRRLDVGLVDVSGKGSAAGARAVLLSGALEALINAVPPSRFLPAANDHVLRIGDEEGFATAVQVSVDLVSGEYSISGAGHPPGVHYRAGAGQWDVLEAEQGPALGLLAGAAYPAQQGVLARGDVLLLFTDGLVENRHLDLTRGIDRLVGHADAVVARGGLELASAIAEAIRAEDGDDRALVLIRRS